VYLIVRRRQELHTPNNVRLEEVFQCRPHFRRIEVKVNDAIAAPYYREDYDDNDE